MYQITRHVILIMSGYFLCSSKILIKRMFTIIGKLKKISRNFKFNLIRLFRLRTGAKQIASGIVIGFFPCWFPTFGVGPFFSIVLTKYVNGNIVAAIISATVGSFAWPLLFYMNYKMGAVFINRQQSINEIEELELEFDYELEKYIEPIEKVNMMGEIGLIFITGSIVNSIIFTVIGYIVFYYIFKRYRQLILKKLR